MTLNITPLELAELQAELNELDAQFAEFGLEDLGEGTEAMSELDAELEGTDLGELSMGGESFGEMFTDDIEQQFVGRWLKNKAKKIIAGIVRAVRKARGCSHCMAKVLTAVRLFKQKKYVAAIRAAYSAAKCIKACLK